MFIKKTSIIFLSLISLLVSINVFAIPNKCPSVKSIQLVGPGTSAWYDGRWNVSTEKFITYDTNSKWGFTIVMHNAHNAEEALTMARKSLSSLRYVYGPYPVPVAWVCFYESADGANANTFTTFP